MSVTNIKSIEYGNACLNFKITALNAETGEFKEKLLTPEQMPRDCLIGRHPSCDLVLDSLEVSRIHGRLCFQDGQCFYTDFNSRGGSQINEQQVKSNQVYLLKQNSLLRIGRFVLAIAQITTNDADQIQSSAKVAVASALPRYWSSGEITVRCIQAIAETHDVKTFRFVAEPSALFDYKPGQFVTLDLEIEGKRVMRSYSISSTPSRPHILEITVKRVPSPINEPDAPPGLVSNWLHEHITVGSQVKLTGVMGKFTCVDRTAQKLLFISAGSGITPMMSMSRWLCDTGANIDIIFIHSVRSPRNLIFRHELESMAARYNNFKLAVTTTDSEPGQAWAGYTGRLNDLMLQAIAPDLQERTVYLCGSNPFMEEVKTILETLGLPMENYHQESFGGSLKRSPQSKSEDESEATRILPKCREKDYQKSSTQDIIKIENTISVDATQHQSSVVVFTKSGKEIPCDWEDIILEVAEQEGVELPFGCRMGACGACKLPLLEGEVNYDEDPVCEPGHLLSCIAKANGRVLIEA